MTTLAFGTGRRMRRHGAVFVAVLTAIVAVWLAPPAAAQTTTQACPRGRVVLLHDLAQTGADLAPLAARLRAAGW